MVIGVGLYCWLAVVVDDAGSKHPPDGDLAPLIYTESISYLGPRPRASYRNEVDRDARPRCPCSRCRLNREAEAIPLVPLAAFGLILAGLTACRYPHDVSRDPSGAQRRLLYRNGGRSRFPVTLIRSPAGAELGPDPRNLLK